MIYNNLEEASVYIDESIHEIYCLDQLFKEFLELEIKRVIIKVSVKLNSKYKEILKKYYNMVEIYINGEIDFDICDYVYFINERIKNNPLKNEIFTLKINFEKKNEIDRINKFIETNETKLQMYKYILLEINFSNVKNDITKLSKIEYNKTNISIHFNFDYIPKKTILAHPCNLYLCSGGNCHSAKSNLPRYIYINEMGEIIPYKLQNSKYRIGSLKENNFKRNLDEYINSQEHNNFISLCKKIRLEYLHIWPFYVIPIKELLNELS